MLTQVVVARTLRRLAAETRFTATYVDTALPALAAAELVEREVMPHGARVRFLRSLFGGPSTPSRRVMTMAGRAEQAPTPWAHRCQRPPGGCGCGPGVKRSATRP